jgi:hypothetical protein
MVDPPPNLAVRAKGSKADKTKKQPKEKQAGNVDTKGLTVTRSQDISLWFTEMITKAGIVSYYDVQDM